MSKALIKMFESAMFFTEDMLYILYSEEKLKGVAKGAKSYYEDESNADWKRAYMKARYNIVKRRLDNPKSL